MTALHFTEGRRAYEEGEDEEAREQKLACLESIKALEDNLDDPVKDDSPKYDTQRLSILSSRLQNLYNRVDDMDPLDFVDEQSSVEQELAELEVALAPRNLLSEDLPDNETQYGALLEELLAIKTMMHDLVANPQTPANSVQWRTFQAAEQDLFSIEREIQAHSGQSSADDLAKLERKLELIRDLIDRSKKHG